MSSATLQTTQETAHSAGDQLAALGWHLNMHQRQAVHLAARYEEEMEWFCQGLKSASAGIAARLQINSSTAREWIRVGHALRCLPLIDAAFAANEISYAKVRILTRWADPDNQQELLSLAGSNTAHRLTTAIAKALATDDEDRDTGHHEARSVTSYTDGDGMVVIRIVLPPSLGKPVLGAVDTLVERIAQTPADSEVDASGDAPAGAPERRSVAGLHHATTARGRHASAGASGADAASPLHHRLRELRRRWQPGARNGWAFPTRAQQRADAFAALFLGLDVRLITEVVIHVRGDGNTFDDGTPITTNAITRQLDRSYIRLMIHDANRKPIDASNKRRHPTARQHRVVMETHHHQCVDCGATDLLELDHNPPFQQTGHTVTTELQPRCAPCHRARHRTAA